MSRRVLAGTRARFPVEELEGDDFDRKVLGDFLTADGRLKAIPMQEKKRLVVLRRLAQAFSVDERYSEKQVNEILRQVHLDTATLRRLLVDHGFLLRSQGVYWKA